MESPSDSSSDQPPDTSGLPAPSHSPGDVFTPGQSAPAPPAPPYSNQTMEPPGEEPAPAPVQPTTPTPTSNPAQMPAFMQPQIPNSISPPAPPNTFNPQPLVVGSPPSKKSSWLPRKPVPIMLLVILFLLGGSAGAYFGYYVPNKPENIWKTALTNTGKGYDKLSQYAENQFKSNSSGVKLSGGFKIKGEIAADGTFSGSSDSDNGEFTASLSATGVKVNLDTRVIKSAGNTPDIYFKLDGLQGIGNLFGGADQQYVDALNGLNGKWYFVDHTLFDQFAQGVNTSMQVTPDDVHSVLKAIGDASKQNIFTSDQSKMAFTVKRNVGKETQDNRKVYHYVAAVNKANLKSYVNTLCGNLKNSNLKKFFNNDPKQLSSDLGCDTASKSVDNFDANRTADVWVDMRTKLIHKIRFTDQNNKDNYFDVGQDYQGGDKFPFRLGFHSKDSGLTTDGSVNITLDTKANSLAIDGAAQDSGSDNFGGSFNLTVSPNNTKVNVQKPANAKTLIELLNDLGFGDIYSGVQSSAKDTERKTDINALHGQAEAYQATNGYYPTLADFNDSARRAQAFPGLDAEALKDPDGSAAKLVAQPATHVYAYEALPSGCDNNTVQCTDYTLTATLDDGTTYVKQALNFSDNSLPVNIN